MFRKKNKDGNDTDTVDGRSVDRTVGGTQRKSLRKSKSFQRIKGFVTGETRRKKRQERIDAAHSVNDNKNNYDNDPAKESSTRRATNASGAPNSLMAPFGQDDFGDDDESTIMGVQVDDASVITGITNTSQYSTGNKGSGTNSSSTTSNSKKGFLRGSGKISNNNSNNNNNSILRSASTDSVDGGAIASSTTGNTNLNGNTTSTIVQTTTNDILKIVLLLMDTKSRRFELLQLEFDSQKALVSDVLGQIPYSVTETSLCEQSYCSICRVDSTEIIATELLSKFCNGNEVLVAMPTGSTPKECVRLARPILCDDKVVSMLKSSNIDATAWKLLKKTKKRAEDDAMNAENATTNNDSIVAGDGEMRKDIIDSNTSSNNGGTRGYVLSLLGVILISILLQVFHLYISTPVAPGSVVPPGVWLNKCGLGRYIPTSKCIDLFVHVGKDGTISGYNSQSEIIWEIIGTSCNTTAPTTTSSSSNTVDLDEITATTTGLPTSPTTTSSSSTSCIPGMQFTKDLQIIIGGKHIKYINKGQIEQSLSPWPFEYEPKLKSKPLKR